MRRIFGEAEEQGLPAPEIIEIGMRVRLIVRLAEPLPVEMPTAQVDLDILAACAPRPLSSAQIAAALGHRQLSGNLRKALPRLKNAGWLAHTIPDKPKSRLQKYRLTDKGKALLAAAGGRHES